MNKFYLAVALFEMVAIISNNLPIQPVNCEGSPLQLAEIRPKEVISLLDKLNQYSKGKLREIQEITKLRDAYELSQGWDEAAKIEDKLYQPLALLISDLFAIQIELTNSKVLKLQVSTKEKLKSFYNKIKPEYKKDVGVRAERIDTVIQYLGIKGQRALKRMNTIEDSMKYCNRLDAIQVGIPRSIDLLARSLSKGSLDELGTTSRYLFYPDDSDLSITEKDFDTTKEITFPKIKSSGISLDSIFSNELTWKTYAPKVFRNFRLFFGINTESFLRSFGGEISELSNPGASGEGLYKTFDDKYFVKTMQPREADTMLKMLPRYYMYFLLHPHSLLPKFLGQYAYVCARRITRLYSMPNLLPKQVKLDEKYDLKGSKYKRLASDKERAKKSPTFKDLDFISKHSQGFELEPKIYDELIKTLTSDSQFLASFEIMDYSLLLGVQYLDNQSSLRGHSMNSNSLEVASTTPEDSFATNYQVPFKLETLDTKHNWSGVPAKTANGQEVHLYIGLIDTMQTFRLKKKMENKFKLPIQGADISVQEPHYYSQRFVDFMSTQVFRRRSDSLEDSSLSLSPPSSNDEGKEDQSEIVVN